MNNCTIYLELSSQMSNSEFEQLLEPKLQLSQINDSLVEQQPTQFKTLLSNLSNSMSEQLLEPIL